MTCRICLEDGNTIKVCGCEGTHEKVHLKCIREWREHSQNNVCEICLHPYNTEVLVYYEPCVCLLGMLLNAMHGMLLWHLRDKNPWVVLFLFFCIRILILCDYEAERKSSKTTAACCSVIWYVAFWIGFLSVCLFDDSLHYEIVQIDMSLETLTVFCCLVRSL